MVSEPGGGGTSVAATGVCADGTYRMFVSGSRAAPGQFVPPYVPGMCSDAFLPAPFPWPATTIGKNIGPYA